MRGSGAGWWVGIEELGPKAQAVIDEAGRRVAQLRAAPYVVVDVRGNGGGDDHYLRELAQILYGKPHVDAILGPDGDVPGGPCPNVYRASAGNIQALSAAAQMLRKNGNTHGADSYDGAVRQMRAALAAGHALTGPATCTPWKPAAGTPPSLSHAKVFILTDFACFSSCINGVGFFRKLGATQIGMPTSADTHYSEVRQMVLPSGLATFSTLQGLMPGDPAALGPFEPAIPYHGDIAGTAALEQWVAALASGT